MIHPTADVSPDGHDRRRDAHLERRPGPRGRRRRRDCNIGKGVYIDTDVVIGDKVKIQNRASLYRGVTVEDGVFIGPHVVFTNDRYPRAITPDGRLQTDDDWQPEPTLVRHGASIGAGSVIISGVTIGRWAMVGAGSSSPATCPTRRSSGATRPASPATSASAAAASRPARRGRRRAGAARPAAPSTTFRPSEVETKHDPHRQTPHRRRRGGGRPRRPLLGAARPGPARAATSRRHFAALCGARDAVAVSSGTAALMIALAATASAPATRSSPAPFTFAATANAVLFTGARPVFVDVRDDDFNIDPSLIEATITPRTRAILPVHLYGQPCDMDGDNVDRRAGTASSSSRTPRRPTAPPSTARWPAASAPAASPSTPPRT